MAQKLRFSYDAEGDILEISKGKPRRAISKDLGDDIWLKVDPQSGEILGFTILSFVRRFTLHKQERTVPVSADFRVSKPSR
ncbi:MAG: DUF2283 domain-containing protein [Candidatus Bipolaricaulota bacterium]|nr:DUF2283 domain-containing protein [Candidatus Bipolaricaulota bacterium]MCS7274881.1 DUF2283 domain-containing protein [Candidatus Bipolaricaulota bacterium]MDW8111160.1 DUF2283 domain-containing protein [Candidatus Bipolaricaulota bacterium]MDW8329580.1 DUF2283 domain-containing protein [Candidatus Bipolaricaulota bacterium]